MLLYCPLASKEAWHTDVCSFSERHLDGENTREKTKRACCVLVLHPPRRISISQTLNTHKERTASRNHTHLASSCLSYTLLRSLCPGRVAAGRGKIRVPVKFLPGLSHSKKQSNGQRGEPEQLDRREHRKSELDEQGCERPDDPCSLRWRY